MKMKFQSANLAVFHPLLLLGNDLAQLIALINTRELPRLIVLNSWKYASVLQLCYFSTL